ncbi:hypothetical protein HCH54_001163 [Aspergillus fumigatus]
MISHQLSVIIKIIDIPKDTEQEFVHHFFFPFAMCSGLSVVSLQPCRRETLWFMSISFYFIFLLHGMPAFSLFDLVVCLLILISSLFTFPSCLEFPCLCLSNPGYPLIILMPSSQILLQT